MVWPLSVGIAALCFALHALAIKILGEKLPPAFVTPAFYSVAVIMLYAIYLWQRPQINWELVKTPAILWPLLAAGITIGLTDYFFVRSLNQGAPLSYALPLFLGGSTILVAIASALILKETMDVWKVMGIVMIVGGIFLIHKS